MRLPPDTRTLDDSRIDDENQFQGRMPQNMKSEYGCRSGDRFGSTCVNTKE
jgi:hypothetical protein